MGDALYAVIGIVGALLGAAIGWMIGKSRAQANARQIEAQVEAQARQKAAQAEEELRARLLSQENEARQQAQNIVQSAEKDAEQVRRKAQSDAESELKSRRAEADRLDQRLTGRETKLDERATSLDQKQNELAQEEKRLQRLDQSVSDRSRNLQEREGEIETRLQEIAGMSRDQARDAVIADIMEEARMEAARQARRLEDQTLAEADKRAKKILAVTIQRYAGEYVTERCVTVVNLPSDDMKGRIIGREGRNIRAIEAATGCDLIIDDTPEAIVVSGFDPVRREVARQALERLMADGRIHPARIEEIVGKTNDEMERTLREAGEQAVFELGLTDMHPEIVRTIGRLKYRTSYGQNIWAHSIEVGFLCGLMAAELGLNVKMARRAGLLHDLGKAMDHEMEGGHAIIGANFIKKYGEDDLIVNAVGAHHEEMKPNSVIAHLVIAADALSGARPGARREILESYVKRIEDLENISRSFDGVRGSYAIQAGREVRVIVENDKVNDDQAAMLSRDIARKIEQELTYPGQITVTVIREVRSSEVAR